VDYILGAEPGGGVFVVCRCDHPYQKDMLAYYKMGNGPYYLFCRPFHLCHIEAMETIIDAARRHKALLTPGFGMKTNVFAYAKKDLKAGETLDGLGGYTCYGQIERLADTGLPPGLPICLAHGVVLERSLHRDIRIRLEDIRAPGDRTDFTLYHKALALSS
jgi:predicted homoserine dehydrogenase-like protein